MEKEGGEAGCVALAPDLPKHVVRARVVCGGRRLLVPADVFGTCLSLRLGTYLGPRRCALVYVPRDRGELKGRRACLLPRWFFLRGLKSRLKARAFFAYVSLPLQPEESRSALGIGPTRETPALASQAIALTCRRLHLLYSTFACAARSPTELSF